MIISVLEVLGGRGFWVGVGGQEWLFEHRRWKQVVDEGINSRDSQNEWYLE